MESSCVAAWGQGMTPRDGIQQCSKGPEDQEVSVALAPIPLARAGRVRI